jgi:hypothetical protein
MKFSKKHIVLILALLSTIFSFLFFARQHDTYMLLNFGGILISIIFYLIILFSKDNIKSKLAWTSILVLAIFIEISSSSYLIESSYFIFLKKNYKELNEVNKLLENKVGEISVMKDYINDNGALTEPEKIALIKLREKLGVYMIVKSDVEIYYGLWGFLDNRLGVTYCMTNKNINNSYRHIKENWYH